MTTVHELIAYLQRHFRPDAVIAADIWHCDDVRTRAVDRGQVITDEQAEAVIEHMDRHHDATLGFTWSIIDAWLHELVGPAD